MTQRVEGEGDRRAMHLRHAVIGLVVLLSWPLARAAAPCAPADLDCRAMAAREDWFASKGKDITSGDARDVLLRLRPIADRVLGEQVPGIIAELKAAGEAHLTALERAAGELASAIGNDLQAAFGEAMARYEQFLAGALDRDIAASLGERLRRYRDDVIARIGAGLDETFYQTHCVNADPKAIATEQQSHFEAANRDLARGMIFWTQAMLRSACAARLGLPDEDETGGDDPLRGFLLYDCVSERAMPDSTPSGALAAHYADLGRRAEALLCVYRADHDARTTIARYWVVAEEKARVWANAAAGQ
jgi:hypothetical protein